MVAKINKKIENLKIFLLFYSLIRTFAGAMKMKRRISAWLLLSVFLPMLLISSLHIHEEAPVSNDCYECVNHIPHQGHLSLNTIHLNDCVLCQLATLPFLMAAAIFVTIVSWGPQIVIVQPSAKLQLVVCHYHSPRAPPVFI